MEANRTTYPLPEIVDRGAWQTEVDQVLVREKAHTREGDAIGTRAVLSALPRRHLRDVVPGPYNVSVRYRDFMGWDIPWYSAQDSADALLGDPPRSLSPLVCYLRNGSRVFEPTGPPAAAWSRWLPPTACWT